MTELCTVYCIDICIISASFRPLLLLIVPKNEVHLFTCVAQQMLDIIQRFPSEFPTVITTKRTAVQTLSHAKS